MATYLDLIKKLMKPDGIRLLGRPSSVPELAISFRNDPVVQRLLKAGRRDAPLFQWSLSAEWNEWRLFWRDNT